MKDRIDYESMLKTHKNTRALLLKILEDCELGNIKPPAVCIFPREGPPNPWVQLYASQSICVLQFMIQHLNTQIQICENNIKANRILN